MPVPLHRLSANIGQPFSLPVIEGPVSKAVMNSILVMIMERIASLLPAQYRGVYADRINPAGDVGTPVSNGAESAPPGNG